MTKEYTNQRENTARASTVYAPVSFKQSVQIMNVIREKPVKKALAYLEQVLEHKKAIPFKKFNRDTGHKPGIGPGRFCTKACAQVTSLINNAVKNAQDKGLDDSNLMIIEAVANRGMSKTRSRKYGRGRITNLWVVVQEQKSEKAVKKEEKKEEKVEKTEKKAKAPAKKTAKKAVKKEEVVKTEDKQDEKK